MPEHKWRVVHRDGREWTRKEIHKLRIFYGYGYVSADACAINEDGEPILLSTHTWCFADEATDDMEVIWDG